MLPIVDKPVVQYVVEELAAAGIDRVLLVTGRRKRAIEDHFDADPELAGSAPPAPGVRLFYTRQPTPAGLGDAVALGDGFADAASPGIVVALGDGFADAASPGIVVALGDAIPGPRDDGGAGIVEKPAPDTVESRLAVAARYVLGPAVFAALREQRPGTGGEIQLTDAIASVIGDGGRVLAVPLSGGERRHDIGTIEGYCRAFLEHALTEPKLGAALRAQASALLRER